MRSDYREGGGFEEAAAYSRAHGYVVNPSNTTSYVSGSVSEGVVVEVELEAVVPAPPR